MAIELLVARETKNPRAIRIEGSDKPPSITHTIPKSWTETVVDSVSTQWDKANKIKSSPIFQEPFKGLPTPRNLKELKMDSKLQTAIKDPRNDLSFTYPALKTEVDMFGIEYCLNNSNPFGVQTKEVLDNFIDFNNGAKLARYLYEHGRDSKKAVPVNVSGEKLIKTVEDYNTGIQKKSAKKFGGEYDKYFAKKQSSVKDKSEIKRIIKNGGEIYNNQDKFLAGVTYTLDLYKKIEKTQKKNGSKK